MSQTIAALPPSIIGKSDIVRLAREIEQLDDVLREHKLKGGETPQISEQIQAFADATKQDLQVEDGRKVLLRHLEIVRAHAPVVHMSFAVNPSGDFLSKITEWFRKEVHPQTLVQVGLQPSLAAGCTVRTTSKYFDFSLRQHLVGQERKLFESFPDEVAHE